LKDYELTDKRMLFLTLLATLILVSSYTVLLIEVKAMGISDLPSLQNASIQPEEKFQVYGCKNNSTCVTQIQSFPFVLPFP
jgi:hypothetical protein